MQAALDAQQQAMLQQSAEAQAQLCLEHAAQVASLQAQHQASLAKAAYESKQASEISASIRLQREQALQAQVQLEKEASSIYLSNLQRTCSESEALRIQLAHIQQQQQSQTAEQVQPHCSSDSEGSLHGPSVLLCAWCMIKLFTTAVQPTLCCWVAVVSRALAACTLLLSKSHRQLSHVQITHFTSPRSKLLGNLTKK